MVLYYAALYYCARVGYFVSERLDFGLYNMALNIGLTGVKWVWPNLLFAVLNFLIGAAIVIVLMWRVFLKDYKKIPLIQLTLANFTWRLLSFSVIGFFGGVAAFSVDSIISLINVIARLGKL